METELRNKQAKALKEVWDELKFARESFPPFNSAHEGLAILEEEFEELKEQVFRHQSARSLVGMRKEAKHVAAMAIRFMTDVTAVP